MGGRHCTIKRIRCWCPGSGHIAVEGKKGTLSSLLETVNKQKSKILSMTESKEGDKEMTSRRWKKKVQSDGVEALC